MEVGRALGVGGGGKGMFWNLEGNGERAGGKMEEGDRIAGRSVQEWKVENC